MALRTLSLCSGAGGLELGVKLAEPAHRVICWVEWEARAAANLVARMEEGRLDQAPIWSDLRTFDGTAWRGCVDLVTAGFPCQPFSVAGKQQGVDDPRHLWPHVGRIIRECEPRWVFLENVPGLLTTHTPDGGYAYQVVERGLCDLGYRVKAGLFTAAEIGAPHRRQRLFILAHSFGARWAEAGERQQEHARGQSEKGCRDMANTSNRLFPIPGRQPQRGDGTRSAGEVDMAITGCERLERDGPEGATAWPTGRGCRTEVLAAAVSQRGCSGDCGREDAADADAPGQVLPHWPPGPTELDRWAGIVAKYPELAPATESTVRGMADGMASRLDVCLCGRPGRLRLTGNGVVPQVAALAWQTLMTEHMEARNE